MHTAANAPIGQRRMNAIRASVSDGRLVAVRAASSAGAIASPARAEVPITSPMTAATSHHPPPITTSAVDCSL
jgi:hypothetical protein